MPGRSKVGRHPVKGSAGALTGRGDPLSKKHFLEFEQPIAELETKIEELRYVQSESAVDISEEIDRLSKKSLQLTKDVYSNVEYQNG